MNYRVATIDNWEWQKPVLDKDLTSSPISPSKGNRYLIYGIGSGAWFGQDGNIAEYNGSSWFFINKFPGMVIFIFDENKWYNYITIWSATNFGPISKQIEVDFGSIPISEAMFTIVDTDVNILSHITGNIAFEAPSGKDLDELEMDQIDLKFGPGSGQLTIFAKGMEGYLHDKFKINYLIG